MAAKKKRTECANCARLRREFNSQIAALKEELARIRDELARAKKNSSNSSKPPSGDIVNPPKEQPGGPKGNAAATGAAGQSKRKRGGQPGHKRHQRTPFQAEQIQTTWIHYYIGCPCCGGELIDTRVPDKVLQQVEIQPVPIRIEEHRRPTQKCTGCQKLHCAPWPEDLRKAGLVGPRLTALVAFCKSACHMSFSCIRKFLRDVVGVTISRGQLRKVVGKVTDSLKDPYQQLLAMLPAEERLNVDETGHKENGKRLWTWCFRAAMFTLYKISPSRGSDVLIEVLGKEFNGVIGCDYFSAYRKFMKDFDVAVQFCLAHFIRDVKYLTTHPDRKNQKHGERLLEHLRKLFRIIHRRDEYPTESGFRKALGHVRRDLVRDAIMHSPGTRLADNLGDRFVDHYESFFTFITTPGVEPTNNLAEQAIRFVAIHRRLTQGTRSKRGRDWCERIWTAITTCSQQGRSVFEYLCETVSAHFGSKPIPPLVTLPDTS